MRRSASGAHQPVCFWSKHGSARPSGPLNLRFLLQPTLAGLIAVRAGLRDARTGAPPYLWAAVTDPSHRSALLRGGWKDLRTPFLMALALDAVYQTIVHEAIYLFELLFTATLLPLVPYLVIRGPVNRLARTVWKQEGEGDVRHRHPA